MKPADADGLLRAYSAARQAPPIDPEMAVRQALASVGKTPPPRYAQMTFANPAIGIDDSTMPDFLQHLAALFDSSLGARILNEVAPIAGQRIGNIVQLIQLWQSNPET